MSQDILKRILISKEKPESTRDVTPDELVDLVLVVLNKVKGIEGVTKETAKERELLKRILISKQKPSELKDITPTELIDLVLVVLEKMKGIEDTVQSGILKGDTPVADVDFLSKQSSEQILDQAISKVKSDTKKVLGSIKSPENGKNYQITEKDYETIAQIASDLIDLPDLPTLITQEPESIRDSLELLQGNERLSIEAIKGIDDALEAIYRRIASLPVGNGSGGGKSWLFALGDVRIDGITDGQVLQYNLSSKTWTPGSTPALDIANMTLDDTNLIVVPVTNLQDFADGVDHSLFKARGTGVNTTYVFVATQGGTTFDMPEVFGEIKSDQGYFDIHYTGATGVTVADLTAPSTYVYIDNTNTLQQQTSIPTREDWSRKIFVARIAVNNVTETILGFEYLNNPIGNFTNTSRDLYAYLLAQGVPFKKDQVVTGRTDNLGFDVSAGSLLELGGTGDINNPNILSFDAVANTSYILLERTVAVGATTNLVKFWDNAGVITALGSTTLVGHRLYRFSNGTFAMQYGQGNYANMALAKAGVLLEDYVLNPGLVDATFLGWWLIESIATNTGNTGATTTTAFVEYTIGIQGGVSTGLSGCLLRGNNLSDLLDVSAARTNLGIKNSTPASASATGSTGEIHWDDSYIYICTDTDTWKRTSISTW